MKYCILTKEDALSNSIKEKFISKIKLEIDEKHPDIVISIGGDGTILKAIHKYHLINPDIIYFGVHTGHLGFYANYDAKSADLIVNALNSNNIKYENIDLISCKITSKSKSFDDFAINEITVINPPRTLQLDVYIDDVQLEHFRGTGICISTPYGSTAYNKSLHGSVVDSRLKSMQLTEIAGINSNAYRTLSSPLVLSNDRKILLKCPTTNKVWVTIDSESYEIDEFMEIICTNTGQKVKMGYEEEQLFVQRIKRTFI